MTPSALRRAFRARPGTSGCTRFAAFLDRLSGREESDWQRLASLLETDVVPVVARCHPGAEPDEILSTCLEGAFETWVAQCCEETRRATAVRDLLAEDERDDALAELTRHPRFRGPRAARARALWCSDPHGALTAVEGTASARSFFIARARDRIGEAQRKQRRQSILLSRSCLDTLGIAGIARSGALASAEARSLCGAEIESGRGERAAWRISALPPAHLLSQELTDRVRRMLRAIEALGPEHARVFKLLVEGLSQRRIAEVEGRHPAAISRRIQSLRELCKIELLG
jgi:RNA polymerase sigma factor (sigma-70 family)